MSVQAPRSLFVRGLRRAGRGAAACLLFARALARPPILGSAYVTLLAIRAARSPPEEPQELGTQAHQIESMIEGHFGGEIGRIAVAIVAAAVVYGLVLGVAADALVGLRHWLHPSMPSTRTRRWLTVLGVVVALQAGIEFWAMADAPQLYAAVWYAPGGWRRTVQVIASDVLHPTGIELLGVLGCIAFLAGPRAGWPEARHRIGSSLRELRVWGVATLTRARSATAPIGARGAGSMAAPGATRPTVFPIAAAIAAAFALGLLAFVFERLPAAHARAAADDARPNILILAADSLRADRLDPRTAPHLAALADRGVRFDRTYVSLPRTFPSWVTWLTGRHPHHHGIRSMFPRWEERARDFDALPERLGKAGWSTGVVSDYAGDIFSRVDLGFGTVNVPEFDFRQLVRQHVLERETPLLPVLHSRLGRAAFPVLREMNDAADPRMLARDAVRTMRSLEARGPFFLVVFFSTAHFPYAAPSPFYERFTDSSYRGRFKYDKPVGLGQEAPADARDEQQVRALYDGAVTAIDDAAQGVLDAVEADGISRKTIVIVTGDHGETLFDHGHGQGHGDHLFGDEGTHVPLVIVDPRQPLSSQAAPSRGTPRREQAITRDVDLAPTLYALTGVQPPTDLDGRSLVPALSGQPLSPVLAYAETGLWFTEDIPALPGDMRLPYPGIARLTEVDTQHADELVLQSAMKPLTLVAKHRMVRDDRYKLIYVPTRTGIRWLLFDTRQDPGEEHDVAAEHPDVVGRLQGELWAWMRRDTDMTERGGYLVPREGGARPVPASSAGLVRLGDQASDQASDKATDEGSPPPPASP